MIAGMTAVTGAGMMIMGNKRKKARGMAGTVKVLEAQAFVMIEDVRNPALAGFLVCASANRCDRYSR